MIALFTSIFSALIGPLFSILEKAGIYRAGVKAGESRQAVADLQETAATVRKANEGRANVGGSDDDVDRLLTNPRARGGK